MAWPYTRHQADWKDGVAGATPITEAAMDNIEAGVKSISDLLIPNTLVDAKGDTIVASAADVLGREPVGANDTVFTADSAQARGVIWKKVGNAMIATAAGIEQSKLAFDAPSTYAPSWTASVTNPTIGNGTITGKFVQVGKLVIAWVRVLFGSTTAAGSGSYFLSLPVTAADAELVFGSGSALDAGTARYSLNVAPDSTTRFSMTEPDLTAPNDVSPTRPFTFGTDDSFGVTAIYLAA